MNPSPNELYITSAPLIDTTGYYSTYDNCTAVNSMSLIAYLSLSLILDLVVDIGEGSRDLPFFFFRK